MEDFNQYNDLELVDKYIEECRQFVNPRLLGEVTRRGLYDIINFLPNNIKEAKCVARGRLSEVGKFFGDEEISHIASEIERIKFLQKELSKMNLADADKTLPIIEEMAKRTKHLKDYYK